MRTSGREPGCGSACTRLAGLLLHMLKVRGMRAICDIFRGLVWVIPFPSATPPVPRSCNAFCCLASCVYSVHHRTPSQGGHHRQRYIPHETDIVVSATQLLAVRPDAHSPNCWFSSHIRQLTDSCGNSSVPGAWTALKTLNRPPNPRQSRLDPNFSTLFVIPAASTLEVQSVQ